MKIFLTLLLNLFCAIVWAQTPIVCLPPQSPEKVQQPVNLPAKSVNDLKIVRLNVHFMLKTDGTGNFNEVTDGDGRNYSGYDYARKLIYYMNSQAAQNWPLQIPAGNSIPVQAKKYQYVLDAVYFWRNDATYFFNTINYTTQGKDKDSVFNVFLSKNSNPTASVGGYASTPSTTSHNKYTENQKYWTDYVANANNGDPDGATWRHAINTSHEVGHLLSLSHTVQYDWADPCPVGCPGLVALVNIYNSSPSMPINYTCDDGCADTPTAWEITQANNCSMHPACGWNHEGNPNCSNNLMDYTGLYSLSPCQIGKIHSCLENGLRSYSSCAAVSDNVDFLDIGYPKLSYFGKNIKVGTITNYANLTNQEKVQMYYSQSVELNNFEVRADCEFEVILEGECVF
ncbi:MAG: hypothetical protein ACK5B9_08935 [Flavobacteriia bacterium]|jgi:hypothetical protein